MTTYCLFCTELFYSPCKYSAREKNCQQRTHKICWEKQYGFPNVSLIAIINFRPYANSQVLIKLYPGVLDEQCLVEKSFLCDVYISIIAMFTVSNVFNVSNVKNFDCLIFRSVSGQRSVNVRKNVRLVFGIAQGTSPHRLNVTGDSVLLLRFVAFFKYGCFLIDHARYTVKVEKESFFGIGLNRPM